MHLVHENHTYADPLLPVLFNDGFAEKNRYHSFLHWHEGVEIISVLQGHARFLSDTSHIDAQCGDIVVINSNHIHTVVTFEEDCLYHYLIPDKDFCEEFGVDVTKMTFCPKFIDAEIFGDMHRIAEELRNRRDYYQISVRAHILNIFTRLCRDHQAEPAEEHSVRSRRKLENIKRAVCYIRENYAAPLTIDGICGELGFSKYYFCRMFKEITGQTVFDYLNNIRCMNAHILLNSGQYNVSEAARLCGFWNVSYFTTQYKKYLGALPSETKSNAYHQHA